MVKAVRSGIPISQVARVFGVSRNTVRRWVRRARHPGREGFRDLSRRPHRIRRRVTPPVRRAILLLRTAFRWGTGRIAQCLRAPPPYLEPVLLEAVGEGWMGVSLSRTTVNRVLREAGLNGSPYGVRREWRPSRTSKPDELWQLDIRGPVLLDGRRVRILVVLDDYSRYLVALRILDHEPSTEELLRILDAVVASTGRRPERVLTDNAGQFRVQWDNGCRERGMEAIHCRPRRPQDKGKVERCIRTVNEEYLRLDRRVPNLLEELERFRRWYNRDRFHMGIGGYPSALYDSVTPSHGPNVC
jgi:transposase InsO family protein